MAEKHSNITGTVITVPIDGILPYWRNPRRITAEATNALAESIQRYGYLQPIVVDKDMTIIIGHTRFSAVRKLGWDEVQVLVADNLTPEQVKKLRVVDNRAGEYSEWDFDKLMEELDDLDADLMEPFFPEVAQEDIDAAASDEPDFTEEFGGSDNPAPDASDMVEFVCPKCFYGWEMKINMMDVVEGRVLERK